MPHTDALPAFKPTQRTRVHRTHQRGRYDRETVFAILDSAMMCHIGYVIDGQPYVTPTLFWRDGERLYWHGSSASPSSTVFSTAGGLRTCGSTGKLAPPSCPYRSEAVRPARPMWPSQMTALLAQPVAVAADGEDVTVMEQAAHRLAESAAQRAERASTGMTTSLPLRLSLGATSIIRASSSQCRKGSSSGCRLTLDKGGIANVCRCHTR
jgi:hypothetical protein